MACWTVKFQKGKPDLMVCTWLKIKYSVIIFLINLMSFSDSQPRCCRCKRQHLFLRRLLRQWTKSHVNACRAVWCASLSNGYCTILLLIGSKNCLYHLIFPLYRYLPMEHFEKWKCFTERDAASPDTLAHYCCLQRLGLENFDLFSKSQILNHKLN